MTEITDPQTYAELIQKSQMVSVDALETLFLLTDYGEQGAMDMVHKAKLIHNMAENERITKINMLRGRERRGGDLANNDFGKTVYIHHRSVGGTLTDIYDSGKHDQFFLAIDGRIYPVSGYDLIIVSEPTNEFEEQAVLAEAGEEYETILDIPAGMENIEIIRPTSHDGEPGDCIEVLFTNGFAVCSHFNSDDAILLDKVPKLRYPEPKG